MYNEVQVSSENEKKIKLLLIMLNNKLIIIIKKSNEMNLLYGFFLIRRLINRRGKSFSMFKIILPAINIGVIFNSH